MSMTDSPELTDRPAEVGPRPNRTRRVVAGVAAAVVLVGGVTVAVTRPWDDGSAFCDAVQALPSLQGPDGAGTPASSLAAYAHQLDQVADAAPSSEVADAARTIATYDADLGRILGSEVSPPDVVTATAALDERSDAVAAARTTLGAAITSRC